MAGVYVDGILGHEKCCAVKLVRMLSINPLIFRFVITVMVAEVNH